jgi:predicted small metal-binding protein
MAKVLNCPCGWSVRAETDDDLVAQAMAHAKEVQDMTPTRDGGRNRVIDEESHPPTGGRVRSETASAANIRASRISSGSR